MISSPKTANSDAAVGNVQPTKVSSNQRAVPLPYFAGRWPLPVMWAQSRVYNDKPVAITKKMGKGGAQPTGFDYYGDLFGLVACCLTDYIEGLELNGDLVWHGGISRDEAHPHHTGDVVVPGVCTFRFHWGTPDAPEDWLMLGTCGEDHPGYLDQPKIELKECYFGNNNSTPPSIRVIVERAARFDGLDEQRTREGASGITALAEVIGNDWFGLARPDLVHVASWAALATATRRDKPVALELDPEHVAAMGYISPRVDKVQKFQAFAARVLENYDGWMRAADGQLQAGQFPHDGVAPEDLPTLSYHDFIEPPQFAANDDSDDDVITDAVVTHFDRDNAMEEDSQSEPNMAARDRLKEIREKQFPRPFIITPYQAREMAGELASFYSRPEQACSGSIRRERIVGLCAGDRFKLNDAPSAALMVVRIVRRRDDSEGGRSRLELVQERGLAPLGYVPVPQPEPTLPPPDLVTIEHARMFQLPARFAAYDPEPAVVALAERPTQASAGFTAHFSLSGVSYDYAATVQRWALRAALAAGISAGDATFTINAAGFDLAMLAPQSAAAKDDDTLLLVCGYEIMSIGDVAALGGGVYELDVLRGRRGSAADAHAGGAECYIIQRSELEVMLHADFPRGVASRYFKLAAFLGDGSEQELADALELELVFDDTDVPSPAPLALTAKAEAIFAGWALTDDRTVIAADLWIRNAATPVPVPGTDLPDHTMLGSGFNIGGLAAGTTKYIWVQYRDTIGVRSVLVGPQNATALAAATGPAGPTGNTRERRYIRSALVPSTPTGNTPAGWTLDIPSGTDAVWASDATKDGLGNLVGFWSTPQRLSGSVIFYTSGAPSGHTLIDGDTYFDTNDNFKIYRRTGGSWVASFQPMFRLDGNNNVTGLVKADGTNKDFCLIADKFQIWNGVSADVPFELVGLTTYIKDAFIQTVAAGKVTAGTVNVALALGVSGSITASSGANQFKTDNNGTTFGDPSGVHVKVGNIGTGETAVMIYQGASLKSYWTYSAGTGRAVFDIGASGSIQGAGGVGVQTVSAFSSTDWDGSTSAPLKSSGGAYVANRLGVGGDMKVGGDIYLGMGMNRWLYDGSGNRILQQRYGVGSPADASDLATVIDLANWLKGMALHHGLGA